MSGSAETVTIATRRDARQVAYELWAFRCGQNCSAVARILADEYGEAIPERTVRYWAESEGWAARVRDGLRQLAPATREQTIVELIFGALEASRYLRGVANGDVDLDKVTGKTRVTAAIAILDRGGFSPVGTIDKTQVRQSDSDKRGLRYWYSDQELREMLAAHGLSAGEDEEE